jgi:hypothetical protein
VSDIIAQFGFAIFATCTLGTIVTAIVTETVSCKRVGGLTFVRVGRLSLSYCVVKGDR